MVALLEMSGLGGHVEPVVVAPVHVAHGRRDEVGRREIVEGRDRDGNVIAAELRAQLDPPGGGAAFPRAPAAARRLPVVVAMLTSGRWAARM